MKELKTYPPINSVRHVMTFGKHKGQTVQWVLDFQPSYLLWLRDNSICDVSHSIYAKANAKAMDELRHRFVVRTGRYYYESLYPDDDVWSYFDPH